MGKLSFKEYLDSKKQLIAALAETPVQKITYDVKKYCTLIVGEKDSKQYLPLKPSQKLIVEWRYDDVYKPPNCVSILVDNEKDSGNFTTFWEGSRLQKWLKKNTQ